MGEGYAAGIATEFLDAFRSSDLYSVDAWLEANQADIHMLRAGKQTVKLYQSVNRGNQPPGFVRGDQEPTLR